MGEGEKQHTFSFAAARAAWRPNCVGIPSTRWVELMFLTHVIWKQVADPWREIIVEYARKYSQICLQGRF